MRTSSTIVASLLTLIIVGGTGCQPSQQLVDRERAAAEQAKQLELAAVIDVSGHVDGQPYVSQIGGFKFAGNAADAKAMGFNDCGDAFDSLPGSGPHVSLSCVRAAGSFLGVPYTRAVLELVAPQGGDVSLVPLAELRFHGITFHNPSSDPLGRRLPTIEDRLLAVDWTEATSFEGEGAPSYWYTDKVGVRISRASWSPASHQAFAVVPVSNQDVDGVLSRVRGERAREDAQAQGMKDKAEAMRN
ncbi:hypothetical protein [Pseudoxanthomonas kaohsiungensis]|uniref:Lipoprotein n=1 Tax=Pseudoxanthomonas kaohsiungensis TaxID=283923 RepID=A0ABW3LYA0_9GAMM|nr:hypothetical protein [Pseudoxanthomonas kaohsiungensis]KAF1702880.1 hypothetical protein CSC66_08895 [Pseudoxanthomonas kaohsiungensis]